MYPMDTMNTTIILVVYIFKVSILIFKNDSLLAYRRKTSSMKKAMPGMPLIVTRALYVSADHLFR